MTRRLHLDRTEVLLILAIMFLVSSLMFTLGVMVGMGVPNSQIAVHGAPSEREPSVAHADSDHSKNHDNSEHRAPASVAAQAKEKSAPGSELKKAFRDSKQRALVDMNLREVPENKPQSIVDTEAYFESVGTRGRAPASVPEKKFGSKKNQVRGANPEAVKNLFERRPASKERFNTVAGQFTVQVGSYATSEESEAKVFQLRKSGFNDAYVQSVKTKKGETWYRVGVGSFRQAAYAKTTGEKLVKRKLSSDYFIRQIE